MSEPTRIGNVVPKVLEKIKKTHTERMFEYLDELRESGVTNMYGAGPYLQERFGLARTEAHQVMREWMETFSERHKNET